MEPFDEFRRIRLGLRSLEDVRRNPPLTLPELVRDGRIPSSPPDLLRDMDRSTPLLRSDVESSTDERRPYLLSLDRRSVLE